MVNSQDLLYCRSCSYVQIIIIIFFAVQIPLCEHNYASEDGSAGSIIELGTQSNLLPEATKWKFDLVIVNNGSDLWKVVASQSHTSLVFKFNENIIDDTSLR